MSKLLQEVKTYYDQQVRGKLRGFVEGNQRVEHAWQTIEQWALKNPQRILEVGCGIGDICWRMTHHWPESEVVGLDVSPNSLEIGRKLFGSPRLSFIEGPLMKGLLTGKFDLIVLMDVYEHIAIEDRTELHQALRELRSEQGRIILTFPTPRHLAWLKQHHPEQIQPVDEDVDAVTIIELVKDTGTEVLLYQEVDIWYEGDYAHAVLGKQVDWIRAANVDSINQGIKGRVRKLLLGKEKPLVPSRSQRLALVYQRLGSEFY